MSCELHAGSHALLVLGPRGLSPRPGLPLQLSIHHLLFLLLGFVFLERETDWHSAVINISLDQLFNVSEQICQKLDLIYYVAELPISESPSSRFQSVNIFL